MFLGKSNRPGKNTRQFLRQNLDKEAYLRAVKDPTRNSRRIEAGKRIQPVVYKDFKRWVSQKLGYKVHKIVFYGDKIDETIEISSDEEEVQMEVPADYLIHLPNPSWKLNDEVINDYMMLIIQRCEEYSHLPRVEAFNTHFFPQLVKSGYQAVKSWGPSDVSNSDMVLLPIHRNNHWMLAIIVVQEARIELYDSMQTSEPDQILNVLEDFAKKKWGETGRSDRLFSMDIIENIPRQSSSDGSNCGVFMCQYSEHISRGASSMFSSKNISSLRQQMVRELSNKRLDQKVSHQFKRSEESPPPPPPPCEGTAKRIYVTADGEPIRESQRRIEQSPPPPPSLPNNATITKPVVLKEPGQESSSKTTRTPPVVQKEPGQEPLRRVVVSQATSPLPPKRRVIPYDEWKMHTKVLDYPEWRRRTKEQMRQRMIEDVAAARSEVSMRMSELVVQNEPGQISSSDSESDEEDRDWKRKAH